MNWLATKDMSVLIPLFNIIVNNNLMWYKNIIIMLLQLLFNMFLFSFFTQYLIKLILCLLTNERCSVSVNTFLSSYVFYPTGNIFLPNILQNDHFLIYIWYTSKWRKLFYFCINSLVRITNLNFLWYICIHEIENK